jgi:glycerol uptake facilitator-like aquaporin
MVTALAPSRIVSGADATMPMGRSLTYAVTVVAGAFAVAGIFGGALNPAVSPRAAVMEIFAWPTLWVSLVAQILTGLAVGVTFLVLDPQIGKSAWHANAVAEQPNSTNCEGELQ